MQERTMNAINNVARNNDQRSRMSHTSVSTPSHEMARADGEASARGRDRMRVYSCCHLLPERGTRVTSAREHQESERRMAARRADEELRMMSKGEISQLSMWMRLRGFSGWSNETGPLAAL